MTDLKRAEELAKNICKQENEAALWHTHEYTVGEALLATIEELRVARQQFDTVSDIEVEEQPGVLTWEAGVCRRARDRIDKFLGGTNGSN